MAGKISIALNIILLIAVVNLYVSNGNDSETVKEQVNVSLLDSKLKIAYINSDSLNAKYEFIKDITEDLNKQIDKKERRLERKTQKMQGEFEQLQRAASGMTNAQLQAAQQRVAQMEQELKIIQNDLAEELQDEQFEMQKELVTKLDSFLISFNKKANYDYILKKFNGSEILVANDAFNITDTVISLLNSEYAAEKIAAIK